MKQLILIIASLCTIFTASSQQRVTCSFNNKSLSKSLIEINKLSNDYKINFVYNELEDFTVTTTVLNLTIPEAVRRVVGFYPMRVTERDSVVYVECVQKATAKLRGLVLDEAGQPLSFANVALLSVTDSSLVGGGVANEVGRFVIPCDEAEVIARFSFVGYGTVYRRTHIRNMGKIVMQPDNKVLKETVVEGSRFVQKVDRYVIIPDSILLAHCTDAVDVLKGLQLPGLEIDMAFKSLSVNGQEIVYKINGIPKELRDIQAIHADQILRVEYSDNPGIRYSDRGVGGSLNFILKERPEGGTLYEQAIYCPTAGMHDNHLKGSYNYKNSQFSLSHYFQRRDYNNEQHNNEDTYIGGGDTVRRVMQGEASHFDYWLNYIDAGYVYQYDRNTGFQATYSLLAQPRNRRYPGLTREWVNGQEHSVFNQTSKAVDRILSHSMDLYFGKKFSNKNFLEAQLVGKYSSLRNEGTLTYDMHQGEPQVYHSGVDNSHYSVIGEVTFTHNFGIPKLSVGMQDNWTRATNDYVSGTRTWLKSNNNYTYAELKGRWQDRYTWSLGTGIKLFSVDNGASSNTYVNNHSVVRFGGQPFKGFTFDAYASFTPSLPSLGAMDSVTQFVDNIYAVAGNPSLKPSQKYHARLWLRYVYRKLMVYGLVDVDYRRNPIYEYVRYDDARQLFVGQSINGKYHFRNECHLRLSLNNLWDCLTLQAATYFEPYVTDAGSMFHCNMSAWSYRLEATLSLGKFMVYTGYTGREKSLWGESVKVTGSKWIAVLQFKLNKNLSLMAQGLWLAGRGDYYENNSLSTVNPRLRSQVIRDDANAIRLGVTCNLDFGRKFKQSDRSLRNQDNSSSVTTVN